MATLNVRKLDDETLVRLRVRAARHGVSTEEEARRILRRAVSAPERLGDMAVRLFDFTQRAAEVWRGSKMAQKQRILRSLSLNRVLGDVTLEIEKRQPLDLLPIPAAVSSSRGDWI